MAQAVAANPQPNIPAQHNYDFAPCLRIAERVAEGALTFVSAGMPDSTFAPTALFSLRIVASVAELILSEEISTRQVVRIAVAVIALVLTILVPPVGFLVGVIYGVAEALYDLATVLLSGNYEATRIASLLINVAVNLFGLSLFYHTPDLMGFLNDVKNGLSSGLIMVTCFILGHVFGRRDQRNTDFQQMQENVVLVQNAHNLVQAAMQQAQDASQNVNAMINLGGVAGAAIDNAMILMQPEGGGGELQMPQEQELPEPGSGELG